MVPNLNFKPIICLVARNVNPNSDLILEYRAFSVTVKISNKIVT